MPFDHTVDGEEYENILITFDEDEKLRKGRAGKHPSLLAIQAFIMDLMVLDYHLALENDMEHALRIGTNGNAKFLFGAPRWPEGAFIEGVWVPPKTFIGLRYTGKMRSGLELWEEFGMGISTRRSGRGRRTTISRAATSSPTWTRTAPSSTAPPPST